MWREGIGVVLYLGMNVGIGRAVAPRAPAACQDPACVMWLTVEPLWESSSTNADGIVLDFHPEEAKALTRAIDVTVSRSSSSHYGPGLIR